MTHLVPFQSSFPIARPVSVLARCAYPAWSHVLDALLAGPRQAGFSDLCFVDVCLSLQDAAGLSQTAPEGLPVQHTLYRFSMQQEAGVTYRCTKIAQVSAQQAAWLTYRCASLMIC